MPSPLQTKLYTVEMFAQLLLNELFYHVWVALLRPTVILQWALQMPTGWSLLSDRLTAVLYFICTQQSMYSETSTQYWLTQGDTKNKWFLWAVFCNIWKKKKNAFTKRSKAVALYLVDICLREAAPIWGYRMSSDLCCSRSHWWAVLNKASSTAVYEVK
jgi:hypothetical protein